MQLSIISMAAAFSKQMMLVRMQAPVDDIDALLPPVILR